MRTYERIHALDVSLDYSSMIRNAMMRLLIIEPVSTEFSQTNRVHVAQWKGFFCNKSRYYGLHPFFAYKATHKKGKLVRRFPYLYLAVS